MSRCVRRVLFTVLVFVLGLAVGFTAGLATGLLSRSVDAGWLEAVGTWVGAGITLIAVIVAALAFFSEEYTRRREDRRQVQADERAERAERDRLQRAADVVWYEVDAVFERSAYEALEGMRLPGTPAPHPSQKDRASDLRHGRQQQQHRNHQAGMSTDPQLE